MAVPVDDGLDVVTFAGAFMRLMADVPRLAGSESESRLAPAIAEHLGVDPAELPVVEQTFPVPDHPNVQLALEEVAAHLPTRRLLGLPVEVMHWQGFASATLGPHPRPDRASNPPLPPT